LKEGGEKSKPEGLWVRIHHPTALLEKLVGIFHNIIKIFVSQC